MAINHFPQSLAFLVAFWLNAFLHGIYLMLFLRWALHPRHQSAAIYFKIFCWFAFIASNIDFAINLYLLVKAFWFSLPEGGPDVFFADLSNWQTVLRELTYQLLVSACDTLMIFRLYRIWGRNKYIIIIPTLILIAETTTGFMAVGRLSLHQFNRLSTAVTLLVAFNTGLQIIITFLIAIKLLDPREIRFLPQTQRSMRFQLVRCLIESGLLITVALILDLALFVQGILFHWVFNISLTQLYAITTVLIVLRMGDITDSPYRSHNLSNPSRSGGGGGGGVGVGGGTVGVGKLSTNSQSHIPSHANRIPVNVSLFPETRPSDLEAAKNLPIGSVTDGIELNGYDLDMESDDRKSPLPGVYVRVTREIHNEV